MSSACILFYSNSNCYIPFPNFFCSIPVQLYLYVFIVCVWVQFLQNVYHSSNKWKHISVISVATRTVLTIGITFNSGIGRVTSQLQVGGTCFMYASIRSHYYTFASALTKLHNLRANRVRSCSTSGIFHISTHETRIERYEQCMERIDGEKN